jgi:hypothetical protein
MKAWINGFFAGWVSGYICIYMRNSSFGRRDDVNSITRPGCIYLYVVVQRSFSGKRFCQLLSARAHALTLACAVQSRNFRPHPGNSRCFAKATMRVVACSPPELGLGFITVDRQDRYCSTMLCLGGNRPGGTPIRVGRGPMHEALLPSNLL